MEQFWYQFFPIRLNHDVVTGSFERQAPVQKGNYFFLNVKFIHLNESSIIYNSTEGNMLISESLFEDIKSSKYGAIFYELLSSNKMSDFIIRRSCAYNCCSLHGSYHFLVSILKNDYNRNWLLDTSVSWCGYSGSNGHCIRRQFCGDIVNKGVNDSYGITIRHAGPSLYNTPTSKCNFLTISHNNCTEGAFYHISDVANSFVQYCVFSHNTAVKSYFLIAIGPTHESLTISNCVFSHNTGTLVSTSKNVVITGCVFEESSNLDTSNAPIESVGDFAVADVRMMHFARWRCEAEYPLGITRRARRFVRRSSLVLFLAVVNAS